MNSILIFIFKMSSDISRHFTGILTQYDSLKNMKSSKKLSSTLALFGTVRYLRFSGLFSSKIVLFKC